MLHCDHTENSLGIIAKQNLYTTTTGDGTGQFAVNGVSGKGLLGAMSTGVQATVGGSVASVEGQYNPGSICLVHSSASKCRDRLRIKGRC